MRILHYLKAYLKWFPNQIFSKNRGGEFFADRYYSENYDNTKFGEFIETWPTLLEIFFKMIYYIISWPCYLITATPIFIFLNLFIPQKRL